MQSDEIDGCFSGERMKSFSEYIETQEIKFSLDIFPIGQRKYKYFSWLLSTIDQMITTEEEFIYAIFPERCLVSRDRVLLKEIFEPKYEISSRISVCDQEVHRLVWSGHQLRKKFVHPTIIGIRKGSPSIGIVFIIISVFWRIGDGFFEDNTRTRYTTMSRIRCI